MARKLFFTVVLCLSIVGCGDTVNYYYPDGGGELPPPLPGQDWTYSETTEGDPVDIGVDPSIMEERMLALPGRFLRELEKADRQPFALLTIEGEGVSDEVDTETEWGTGTGGKQVDSSNVDYTASPPESGDVILAVDMGSETDTPNAYNDGDESSQWDSGDYSDIDDTSDTDYIETNVVVSVGPNYEVNIYKGSLSASQMPTIPDNAFIKQVDVVARVGSANPSPIGTDWMYKLGINYDGTWNWSTQSTAPTSFTQVIKSWPTVPGGSSPWTKADIAKILGTGIEAEVEHGGTGDNVDALCSSLALVVTYYDFETSGYIEVEFDLAGASEDNDGIISIDEYIPDNTDLNHEIFYPSGTTQEVRPSGHDDIDGKTTDEASAYDDDDTDASTTTSDSTGSTFLVGILQAGTPQWNTVPSYVPGTVSFKAIVSRAVSASDATLAVNIKYWDGAEATLIEIMVTGGTSAVSKATFTVELDGYEGDLEGVYLEVYSTGGGGPGEQSLYIYDCWIEGEIWATASTLVQDGTRIPTLGAESLKLKSTFTSDGTATPVLSKVGIEVPDYIYKYSTLSETWNDALPLLAGIPGRTIKLNMESFITEGSSLTASLVDLEHIAETLLAQEYMRGLPARIDVGFYAQDVTEDDLVPYYQGTVQGYKIAEGKVSVSLKDATKDLSYKVPESSGTTPGTIEYDGDHMVDVILDLIDRAGVPSRFIDVNSLSTVKADMGVGTGDPAPTDFIVYRSDNHTPDTIISDPKPAKDYIKELLELVGAFLVIQEDGQLRLQLYDSADSAVESWTDTDIFLGASFNPQIEETLRNATVLYYDWNGEGDTADKYVSVHVGVDTASILAWGQVNKIIKSKWIAEAPATGEDYNGADLAEYIADREALRLANGVGVFACKTSLDKLVVQVGDMVTVYSDLIVSENNQVPGAGAKMLVIKKTWSIDSGEISWELAEAT